MGTYSKDFILRVKLDHDWDDEEEHQRQVWTALTQLGFRNFFDEWDDEEKEKQVWTALLQLGFTDFFDPTITMQLHDQYATFGDDVSVTIALEEIWWEQ